MTVANELEQLSRRTLELEEKCRQLENQLLQIQKMEAIGILAGGVAHDFNNLLNVINGYSELLLEDLAVDNPIRADIEQIHQAGQQATTLTSQLQAFSWKQIVQSRDLDLNSIISQISKMLRRLIRENVEFVSIQEPDLKLIHADPDQIQQIVMNLAIHARETMQTGGKLTVETANVEFDEEYVQKHPELQTGKYVMLAISDNGTGMDQETQSHLFEPFYTTKKRSQATGMGLVTVYEIVKQSKGFIQVYSEPGKGTTFKIYFPQLESGSVKPETAIRIEADAACSETILVAEDETALRTLSCRILKNRGYSILEATNGEDALRIARENSGEIHMVLTDVVMPGLNGPELVAILEKELPGVKSLFVSRYTDNTIAHHDILESNISFLQKPFTAEDLIKKVRNVLDS